MNISNGGVYSGATSATLTLTNAPSNFNGRQYDVVITGTCTNLTSAQALLTVKQRPEVTVDPVNQTICENANTTFTVNAGVTTNPGYQWQVSTNNGVTFANIANGGIYAGATAATLTLTAAPLANNGFVYRAIISGDCGPNATSNAAQLTVRQNVVISTPPQPSVICETTTTQFSVAAIGTGITYQWRENGVNITNGGVYSGATSATLSLTNVPATFNGRQYDVVVTGTCTTQTSAQALLTVNRYPAALASDASICSGVTTNISISDPNGVSGSSNT